MSQEENNAPVPIDNLPAHWRDNDRLNVYYSPVRSKQVNRMDWTSKYEFWRQSIEAYCTHKNLYTFTLVQLEAAFHHNGRKPACLGPIVRELAESGDLLPSTEFSSLLQSSASTTWGAWTGGMLLKTVTWPVQKLKGALVSPNTNVEYVHMTVIKTKAHSLLSAMPAEHHDKVMTVGDFANVVGHENADNLKLLLQYMAHHKMISLREVQRAEQKIQMTLVKVTRSSEKGAEPITEIDVDIYILGLKEKQLIKTIANFEEDQQQLIQLTKKHLVNKQQHLARSYLRKKRLLEKSIEECSKHLLNVSTLLQNLENASQNQAVLSTYKCSIDTLKVHGLDVENVEDTMNKLHDYIDTANEIQETLGQSLDSNELDLEEELAALLKEEEQNTSTQEELVVEEPKVQIEEVMEKLDELKFPDITPAPQTADNFVKSTH